MKHIYDYILIYWKKYTSKRFDVKLNKNDLRYAIIYTFTTEIPTMLLTLMTLILKIATLSQFPLYDNKKV